MNQISENTISMPEPVHYNGSSSNINTAQPTNTSSHNTNTTNSAGTQITYLHTALTITPEHPQETIVDNTINDSEHQYQRSTGYFPNPLAWRSCVGNAVASWISNRNCCLTEDQIVVTAAILDVGAAVAGMRQYRHTLPDDATICGTLLAGTIAYCAPSLLAFAAARALGVKQNNAELLLYPCLPCGIVLYVFGGN